MKKWLLLSVGPVLALGLAGCATPDQRIAQLKTENQSLLNRTLEQDQQITSLNQEKKHLTEELNYFTRRSQVLDKEKTERIQESQDLRRGVRLFTDEVMKIMRDNYKKMEIVDYIGGELVPRQTTGSEARQLLVDLLHPLPAGGTLIGGRVYASAPTRLNFCLLRLSADKKEMKVVEFSREFKAEKAGQQQWAFEVPMTAHKGDLIGVYFPEAVAVPYDDVDTGCVLLPRGSAKLNATFDVLPAEARHKRAYSFGLLGFLDKE
jgi:hypothetical protein